MREFSAVQLASDEERNCLHSARRLRVANGNGGAQWQVGVWLSFLNKSDGSLAFLGGPVEFRHLNQVNKRDIGSGVCGDYTCGSQQSGAIEGVWQLKCCSRVQKRHRICPSESSFGFSHAEFRCRSVDPILTTALKRTAWKTTNVQRQIEKTRVWAGENVRNPMSVKMRNVDPMNSLVRTPVDKTKERLNATITTSHCMHE